MPELVEAERFRRLILPLATNSCSQLEIETPSPTPPKTFPSCDDLDELQKYYTIHDVKRKGKLIRVDLQSPGRAGRWLYLHMGMTGRMSTRDNVTKLESLKGDDSYPPPHTHLLLRSNGYEVAFSDPRRFGKVALTSSDTDEEDEFRDLAPDALDEPGNLEGIVGKRKGIKGILLDQKAVVCGVGNWIADEVLYQSRIHPDQTMLTSQERDVICEKLRNILNTAIDCMTKDKEFPDSWTFHRRWSKGKGNNIKDAKGRKVTWIDSGGRSSAIVPAIQKVKSRQSKKAAADAASTKAKTAGAKRKTTKSGGKATSGKEPGIAKRRKIAGERSVAVATSTRVRRSTRNK